MFREARAVYSKPGAKKKTREFLKGKVRYKGDGLT